MSFFNFFCLFASVLFTKYRFILERLIYKIRSKLWANQNHSRKYLRLIVDLFFIIKKRHPSFVDDVCTYVLKSFWWFVESSLRYVENTKIWHYLKLKLRIKVVKWECFFNRKFEKTGSNSDFVFNLCDRFRLEINEFLVLYRQTVMFYCLFISTIELLWSITIQCSTNRS